MERGRHTVCICSKLTCFHCFACLMFLNCPLTNLCVFVVATLLCFCFGTHWEREREVERDWWAYLTMSLSLRDMLAHASPKMLVYFAHYPSFSNANSYIRTMLLNFACSEEGHCLCTLLTLGLLLESCPLLCHVNTRTHALISTMLCLDCWFPTFGYHWCLLPIPKMLLRIKLMATFAITFFLRRGPLLGFTCMYSLTVHKCNFFLLLKHPPE